VGCKIPADMKMIEMLSNEVRVDQAILTGMPGLLCILYFVNRITKCFQLGLFPITFDVSEKCEIAPHSHVLTLEGISSIY
jgi:hypothetical protein